MKNRNPFHPLALWHDVPTVARLMVFGLFVISGWVVWQFFEFLSEKEVVAANEDFFIHVAMLILVPLVAFGLLGISIAYAYYQICKRNKIKPFWEKMDS
jgi:hypothetical protein